MGVRLALGARGAEVRRIQERLAAAGLAPGAVDGVYGPATAGAVLSFQVVVGLPATGEIDDVTAASLEPRRPAAAPPLLYENPLNPHQRRLVSDYEPDLEDGGR